MNMVSPDDQAQKFTPVSYFFSDVLDLHMILHRNPSIGKPARVSGDMKQSEFAELYADANHVVAIVVMISHDELKTRAVAEKLEEWLWEEKKFGDYAAQILEL